MSEGFEPKNGAIYLVQLCERRRCRFDRFEYIPRCIPIAIFDSCYRLVQELSRVAKALKLEIDENAISIKTVCRDAYALRIDEDTFMDVRRIYLNYIPTTLLR